MYPLSALNHSLCDNQKDPSHDQNHHVLSQLSKVAFRNPSPTIHAICEIQLISIHVRVGVTSIFLTFNISLNNTQCYFKGFSALWILIEHAILSKLILHQPIHYVSYMKLAVVTYNTYNWLIILWFLLIKISTYKVSLPRMEIQDIWYWVYK